MWVDTGCGALIYLIKKPLLVEAKNQFEVNEAFFVEDISLITVQQ